MIEKIDFNEYSKKQPAGEPTSKERGMTDYMRITVIPHLTQNMNTAASAGPAYESLLGWTSNNSETMNSVIKFALQFKLHQLQQLIDTIYKEVYQDRMLNLKRAIVGLSDYKLIPILAKLRSKPDKLSQLTSEQQDRLFKKF